MRKPNVERVILKHYSKKGKEQKGLDWPRIATIIGIFLPVFYIVGRVYYETYLQQFGISADLFKLDTQDYLYLALACIFQITIIAINSSEWLSALTWSLVISAYIAFVLYIISPNSIKNRTGLINKTLWPTLFKLRPVRIIGVLSTGPLVVFSVLALLFSITVSFLLPVFLGVAGGKKAAMDEMVNAECAKKESWGPGACTKLILNGKSPVLGRVIAASNEYVAVAFKKKVVNENVAVTIKDEVIILPREQIEFLQNTKEMK